MKKTDNRHYNTRTKRQLAIEMDLWIRFKENDECPVLIGRAVAEPSKGYYGDEYDLYYSPVKWQEDRPYIVRHSSSILNYCVRSESINEAKKALKYENPRAKWVK